MNLAEMGQIRGLFINVCFFRIQGKHASETAPQCDADTSKRKDIHRLVPTIADDAAFRFFRSVHIAPILWHFQPNTAHSIVLKPVKATMEDTAVKIGVYNHRGSDGHTGNAAVGMAILDADNRNGNRHDCCHIVKANAQAVSLLHRGFHTQAIQCLEGTLRHLHRIAAATLVSENCGPDGRFRSPEAPLADTTMRIWTSNRKCHSPTEGEHTGGGGGIFAWHDRPVLMSGADNEQILRSGDNQNRAAAALLFNLSLAYRSASGSRDMSLMCALKMSRMASQLIERVDPQSAEDVHLRVSILSNLGYLQVWFSNPEEANYSLLKLEASLASDLPRFDFSDEVGPDKYQEITDAVCTVVLFQGKSVLPTAPAA